MEFRKELSDVKTSPILPMAFATAFLSSLERITALNVSAVQSNNEDYLSWSAKLLKSPDIREAATLQASMLGSNIEKAFDYSWRLYGIVDQSRTQFLKLLESERQIPLKTQSATVK